MTTASHPQPTSLAPSPVNLLAPVLRVVTFAIADYRLALPMSAVLRVVNCPPQFNQGTGKVEFVHLGQHSIMILNLHHRLTLNRSEPRRHQGQFLIVTHAVQQELCAIRVDTPPDVLELPTQVMRQLPDAYQQGHPLSIASHVAVLPDDAEASSIFILDMQRTVQILTEKKRK
jgi:chemotaxis signal transduction protein